MWLLRIAVWEWYVIREVGESGVVMGTVGEDAADEADWNS